MNAFFGIVRTEFHAFEYNSATATGGQSGRLATFTRFWTTYEVCVRVHLLLPGVTWSMGYAWLSPISLFGAHCIFFVSLALWVGLS